MVYCTKKRVLQGCLAIAFGLLLGTATNASAGQQYVWDDNTNVSTPADYVFKEIASALTPGGAATTNSFVVNKSYSGSGNELIVNQTGTNKIKGSVYGGLVDIGTGASNIGNGNHKTSNNIVRINANIDGSPGGYGSFGSTLKETASVYGGYIIDRTTSALTGPLYEVDNNRVYISNGVTVGAATGYGASTNKDAGYIVGGRAESNRTTTSISSLKGNEVHIYGGALKVHSIIGATGELHNNDSPAPANTLTIEKNKVVIDLRKDNGTLVFTGNYIDGARTSLNGHVLSGNSVEVYSDTASQFAWQPTDPSNVWGIFGARSRANAPNVVITGNSVTLDYTYDTSKLDTKVNYVMGGYHNRTGDLVDNSNVSNNKVLMRNGWANEVMGGYSGAEIITAGKTPGTANNNTVTIERGQVDGTPTTAPNAIIAVAGGGIKGNGTATGNTVNLGTLSGKDDDVVINGVVFGGLTNWDNGGYNANGVTTDNTINVYSKVKFDNIESSLVGGNTDFARNTLNTYATGMELFSVLNFENYNYTIDGNFVDTTVYKVMNATDLGADQANVNVTIKNGVHFIEGEVVTLISDTTRDAKSLSITSPDGTVYSNLVADKDVVSVNDGWLYNYDVGYRYGEVYANSLDIAITGTRATAENLTLGQSQLAGLRMTTIASDFARDIAGLYKTAAQPTSSSSCYDPCGLGDRVNSPVLFAGVKGGTSNWNSNHASKTNLNHVSLLAGLGWRFGGLLLAGYFESGWGSYDAKNGGRKLVDGESTDYIGGGVRARYEANNFYGEAGFHAGRVKMKYNGRVSGIRTGHEMSSTYVGVDAVLGYMARFGCSTFDFSASYSWNRNGGDDVLLRGYNGTTDLGIFRDAIDSHRLRVGGEWSYGIGAFSPYVGAYYEHEFSGKSKGHTVAYSAFVPEGKRGVLAEATMNGSTGIGELGLRYNGGRFSADVGVEGYVGKRRGVSGKAMFGVTF